MPLPTKEEIKQLEKELGFPFRTAFEQDYSTDNPEFYHHTVMEADMRGMEDRNEC